MLDARVPEDRAASQGNGVLDGSQPQAYPCALPQKRFWVLDQLQPGNPSLHVALRWRVEGTIPTTVMEEAFRTIIRRHEVLRYSFSEVDGEPVQTVHQTVPFRIPEIDLRQLPEADAEAEAQRIAELEARASFDLRASAPPYLRVTRLRLADASVLLVTAHHIIFDGWSIGVLAREFVELCDAQLAEREPQLPELALGYGQYAAWQAEIAEPVSAEDAAYWQQKLGDMKHFELPPDRQRPAVQTTNGAVTDHKLPAELCEALHQLGQQQGCTLYTTALAGLVALLHRYTGETDIGISTQAAVRSEVELEPLIGLFVNTLILRNDVSGDPTFADLLARTRDNVAETLERRDMPLENLIKLLRTERDLSRNMLVSINFLLQKSLAVSNADYSIRVSELPPLSSGAIYDLNFFLQERDAGWFAVCEYNTDLYDAGSIQALLRTYETLLRGACEAPQTPVSRLPVLAPQDSQALLTDWNATASDYPGHLTIGELFADQVLRTPEAEAVYCGGRSLSYRQLDEASNKLAHELRAQGVGPGSMVGVILERSVDLAMTLVAILKAGGAYVPIDPAHPAERIGYVIENCKMAALVSRSTLRDRFVNSSAPAVLLDTDAARIASHPDTPLPVLARPEDVAYVIYTSGSTGRPKGVKVHQQALVNLLFAIRREPGLQAGETLVSPSTIAFDIGALEVFLPLVVGARLVIATEAEVFDGAELGRLLVAQKAKMMFSTPVGWQLLLAAGWQGCPGLKMLCGGEALSRSLADQLIPLGDELWNVYGPTETTVFACILHIQPNVPIMLGPPLPNYQFYVLDANGEPAPPGAPGELYIGGDGVGKGYVELPELTAARFIPDRFRPHKPGATLYRTGDIVRVRERGELEYLGRADNQIKLRGFRIELSEIEAVMLRHSGVAEVAVTAGKDARGDGAIWAYTAPNAGYAGTHEQLAAELRSELLKALPRYMCPASLMVLDVLPKLPTGKIDRRSLPKPEVTAPLADAPRAAGVELNETEKRLAQIWSELLGVADLQGTDNFFQMGGHSLLAARALARVHKEFERKVTLSAFFNAPTLSEFAKLLGAEANQREYDFRQVVKLQANGAKTPVIAINNTGIYYQLSKHLGADQPFTSLQVFDPALPNRAMPETFEQIAAEYVKLIDRVQPSGPYILLGWCVAGTLSYEIARQLQAAGREVAHLIMVDSYVPNHLKRLTPLRALLADYSYRWQLIARDWRKYRAGKQSLYEFLCNRVGFQKLMKLLGRPLPQRLTNEDPLAAENFDGWLISYLHQTSLSYEPGGYNGRVTLIRSAEEPGGRFLDYRMGWSEFVGNEVEVMEVSGDHFSIFREPGVVEMSERLAAILPPALPAAPARAA